ncbi:hypothetical protein [Bradyrhizobium genosp. P]|uniref:hypothetical protein n=1 Tax=Bradyrhizobium genosp. P TaxID=83641 RepID=UPI003CE8CD82
MTLFAIGQRAAMQEKMLTRCKKWRELGKAAMRELAGKTAFVTGAASGIGLDDHPCREDLDYVLDRLALVLFLPAKRG